MIDKLSQNCDRVVHLENNTNINCLLESIETKNSTKVRNGEEIMKNGTNNALKRKHSYLKSKVLLNPEGITILKCPVDLNYL